MGGAGAFQSDRDRAAGPLTHACHQICKRQRLALLTGQRVIQRIADQIAAADGQIGSRPAVAVGGVSAGNKVPAALVILTTP